MNPVDRSLIRKEWSEHSRRIATLSGILTGVCVSALPFGVGAVLDVFYLFIGLYYPALGGTFLAMRVVAGERADGTAGFVAGLPVLARRYAMIRLLMGALACCIPVAVSGLFVVVCVAVDPSLPDDRMARGVMTSIMRALSVSGAVATGVVVAISTLSTFSVYVWAGVFGLGAATENAAGVRAVVVLFVAGLIAVSTYWMPGDPAFWNAPGPAGGLAVLNVLEHHRTDAGWLFLMLGAVLAMQIGALVLLIRIWVNRYTLISADAAADFDSRVRQWFRGWQQSRRSTATAARLPRIRSSEPHRRSPHRSVFTALAWKQGRESLPTAVVALGLSMLVVLLSGGSSRLLAEAFLMLGWMMALVMGTAAFLPDVDSRSSLFWRSAPARPTTWFWIQFPVVLMMFGLCVTLPFGLFLVGNDPHARISGSRLTSSAFDVFCLTTLMHALTLTVATAAVCVIRKLAYAGIVSGLLSLAIILIPTTLAADLYDLWDVALLTGGRSEHRVFIATTAGVTGAALITAWLSLMRVSEFRRR